jgi:inhibitor of KinA
LELIPLGESAVIISFGSKISLDAHRKVRVLSERLQKQPFTGLLEFVPAFTTVTVYYDSLKLTYKEICTRLEPCLSNLETVTKEIPRTVEIPICYGGKFGPDIEFVAKYNGISVDEVIQIHTAGEYLVYMIGFAPGFPYFGGMSERLATPRRPSPRLNIPAGSVGIAGLQTGVYPVETPGGWQIIGRTPKTLFRPNNKIPSLLQAGDLVHFRSISNEEYEELEGND